MAPAAAQFPPELHLGSLDKVGGAALGAAGAAAYAAPLCVFLVYTGPGVAFCLAAVGAGAVASAAVSPSREDLEMARERVRSRVGASDVQQLLAQRFSDRVTRLTPLTIDPGAGRTSEGTLVAELAVVSIATGLAGSSRRLELRLGARMRLVRPSDGVVLMTRDYQAARYGRFIQEYDDDRSRLLQAIAGAVDEVATLMVDDAFLPRAAAAPALEALAPLPGGRCLTAGHDCWAFQRVPQLETASPTFRWKPFPGAERARNVTYDLWVFGGEDDRFVAGLRTTEHTLELPLAACMRYSWAVRARFDTDAGPRIVAWSTASALIGQGSVTQLWPTFGAPFMTPCRARSGG